MTIPAATWRQQHSGNGVTIAFTTGFPFLYDEDVRVIHTDADGVDTEWVLDTHFSLTGAHTSVPGTVTVITTPTDYTPQTGETLTILSDIDFTQSLDGDALTTFPASSLEDSLDAVWIGLNQLNEMLSRATLGSETGAGVAEVTSWTPVFATVADGTRRVVQIVEWTGGSGDEPDGGYLSDTGIDPDIANGTDIRGPTGFSGAGTGDMLGSLNLTDVANAATSFANIKQAATTTATGVLEIATDAEAIAKSDTGRALVPSNLSAIGASTTFAGLIEIATVAEAEAGTDTARAVTPEGVLASIIENTQNFPATTAMLFVQTSAPTGWTKSTAHNDKILRLVSGSVSSGGSVAFSTFAAQGGTGGLALTGGYLPGISTSTTTTQDAPSLYPPAVEGTPVIPVGSGWTSVSTSDYSGSGASHAHGLSTSIQYVDCIIATKDA